MPGGWGVRGTTPSPRGKGDKSGYGFNDYWQTGERAAVQFYLDDSALQALDDRLKTFDIDRAYKIDSAKAITAMVRELKEQAMPKSPYLFGVLRGAHISETRDVAGHWKGVVTIDTQVVHHILGGRPAEYGAKLHQEGRPWFEWTVITQADRIIEKHAGTIVSAYSQIWGEGGGGRIMSSSQLF